MIFEVMKLTWKKIVRTNTIALIIVLAYLAYCLYLIIGIGSPEEGAKSMAGGFAFLAVLLSGGLIKDEFESRQIDPFLARFRISKLFWGKFFGVMSLILLAFVLVGVASLIGLAVNKEWSTAGQVLKTLGLGLVLTCYLSSVGFFLASFLKGVMNFVAIIVLEVIVLFAMEEFFGLNIFLESGQLGQLNLKSALLLTVMPSWNSGLAWEMIFLICLSAGFVLLALLAFRSMARKNNLVFANVRVEDPPLLKISDLRMTYKEGLFNRKSKQALRGVDFSIKPGKLTGFLGPNGAGKTTTIRIVLDLLKPQAGTVEYFPNKDTQPQKSDLKIGYLQETASLYPFLTVRETLYFVARNEGMSKEKAAQLSVSLGEKLGLNEHLDRRIKTLSKGTVQKVAFGVATVGEPEFLIFDEPYTGLDPIIMHEIRNLIFELKKRGVSIILSSHLLPEVERVCDEVVLINQGQIVCQGEIDKLKTAWQIFLAIRNNPELAAKLTQKLGEELQKKSFSYFAGLDLEPLLQDEELAEELKQIPSPDMERIFLDSVIAS
ncbi:MAG: ATP-binding cassette domain-containing protein [Acidobacteriota bacterium]|nr:ATP-binding cassette domain-containing protein [Acidobacteriota bacterium]